MASITGTTGNDTLTGTTSSDFIRGLAGNDKLTGGAAFDTIRPGPGNDTLDGGPSDTANTLDYQDLSVGLTITVNNGAGTARGTGKSDTFKNFILFAGTQGNDTFTSGNLTRDGFYSFQGFRGDDRVIGNSAFDELRFEQNDIVRGLNANLVTGVIIDGHGDQDQVSGIERIRATRFADVFTGSNAAIERYQTYAGADVINGGGGIDELDYRREFDEEDVNGGVGSHGISINMATGTCVDSYGQTDTFTGIEEVRGTRFVDTMLGSSNAEQLRGEEGNDVLKGFDGVDVLIGDSGNDSLDGGLGADTLNGGEGNDSYILGADTSDKIIDSAGIDTISTTITRLLTQPGLTSIENLSLVGNALVGSGNGGNNKISGTNSNNRLDGQSGNDTLIGAGGNDELIGGGGSDIFIFNAALNAATNVDFIKDFNVAADTIQLENAIFTLLGTPGAGNVLNTAAFFRGAAAHDSNDRVIYNPATGALTYDTNGSAAGGSTQFATLAVNLAVTNADFVII